MFLLLQYFFNIFLNCSKVVDYVFFIQLGTVLCIPGMLQTFLDHGLFKGFWEFFIKLKVVLISVYSIFHLLNTALYFHFGFIDAAQYLASGRGAGLDHESIGKIVAAFDSSHFVPSIILFLFGLIGIALGGSVEFFFYNMIMGGIWLWSPFFFNRGSFPSEGVEYDTWVKLYSKDLEYVRKWRVKQIISELAKRTKNIRKIERTEEEEAEEFSGWLPDVKVLQKQEAKQLLEQQVKLVKNSAEEEEEADFNKEQEQKFGNRIKYRITWLQNLIRSVTWNLFLLITMTGIKYITLILGIVMQLNPLGVPVATQHREMEHRANEKRFLQLQQLIADLRGAAAAADNAKATSSSSGDGHSGISVPSVHDEKALVKLICDVVDDKFNSWVERQKNLLINEKKKKKSGASSPVVIHEPKKLQ